MLTESSCHGHLQPLVDSPARNVREGGRSGPQGFLCTHLWVSSLAIPACLPWEVVGEGRKVCNHRLRTRGWTTRRRRGCLLRTDPGSTLHIPYCGFPRHPPTTTTRRDLCAPRLPSSPPNNEPPQGSLCQMHLRVCPRLPSLPGFCGPALMCELRGSLLARCREYSAILELCREGRRNTGTR